MFLHVDLPLVKCYRVINSLISLHFIFKLMENKEITNENGVRRNYGYHNFLLLYIVAIYSRDNLCILSLDN